MGYDGIIRHYNEEEKKLMWDSYLEEKFEFNKMLAHKYNTKQALIEALRKLGISEEFLKNEILLQFLITEFDDKLEPFPIIIGNNNSKRLIDNLERIFEDTVKKYINLLEKKLIIKENEKCGLISILDSSYQIDNNALYENTDLHLKKLVNAYYFEDGYINKLDILFDKVNGYTTIRKNNTDIFTRYSKEKIEVLSKTKENTYNDSYKMLSNIKYDIEDSNFDIKNFALANENRYTSMKKLIVNSDLKTCKYIEKDEKTGLKIDADVELEYSKKYFDFMNFNKKNITEETNFNYLVNELSDEQIEYYKRKNLNECDYLVMYDDIGFNSIVYDFSSNLLEQVENLSNNWYVFLFDTKIKKFV